MDFIAFGLAMLVGLVFVFAYRFVSARFSKGDGTSDAIERAFRLGKMRSTAFDHSTDEEETVITKSILEEVLRESTKEQKTAWVANFFWFAAGSTVSVFSSDLRSLIGL